MPVIELDENEWQMVLGILATAPWNQANPLLMKIGNQLRIQQVSNTRNIAEVPSNQAQVGVKPQH